MQPLPFQNIQATPNKQQIQAVQGVIVSVQNPESKVGQYGAYTQQRIFIRDPQTGMQLRVSIFDADPFQQAHIGQTVLFTLGQNNKQQWVGLAADHYQPQGGQMIYGVKAGRGGHIYLNGAPWGGGSAPQMPPQPMGMPPGFAPMPGVPPPPFSMPQSAPVGVFQPSPQPTPFVPPSHPQPFPQPPPPMPQSPAPAPLSPLAFLAGQSAAYVLCFEAAMKAREQLQIQLESGPGEPLTTTDVKDIATTLFIEGNKRGVFNNIVVNLQEPPSEPDQP